MPATPLALSTHRVLTHLGDRPWRDGHRRPLGPLDLRTQAILRAVIEEYVTTATPVGSQALVERYGLGVSSATVRSILAELEAERPADPPAHLRRAHPDRRRLSLLRRVDRRGRPVAGRRAAHDPPPVRPGGVRQRALVPPRRDDARLGHPRGRPRHAGQAARRPHPADRPGRHQRADGQPDPRPARGRHQAGARHARRATTPSTSRRSTRSRRCSTSGSWT